MSRCVLVLGGTGEARELAAALHRRTGCRVVSSLAGRVRNPALPAGEVRVGGFGGVDGLAAWLRAERVHAVVDATHPFAATISANAAQACAAAGVSLLALRRPQWIPTEGDRWHEAFSLGDAAAMVPRLGTRAFLTTGRQGLAAFAELGLWCLVRTVDPPQVPLPQAAQLILDRGPFTVQGEQELLKKHRIDVLVTKNSGGTMTTAKLIAARALGIAVVMVQRPPRPAVPEVPDVAGALAWLDGCA